MTVFSDGASEEVCLVEEMTTLAVPYLQEDL